MSMPRDREGPQSEAAAALDAHLPIGATSALRGHPARPSVSSDSTLEREPEPGRASAFGRGASEPLPVPGTQETQLRASQKGPDPAAQTHSLMPLSTKFT